MIGINRDEDIFGDADTFLPTRWLVSRGDTAKARYCAPGECRLPPADQLSGGWRGLFTFSEGLRICISMTLALFEDKAPITTLIYSFQFHGTGVAITIRYGAMLLPHIKGHEHEGNDGNGPLNLGTNTWITKGSQL